MTIMQVVRAIECSRMNIVRRIVLLCFAVVCVAAAADEAPDPVLRELLRAAANETDSFEDHYAAQVWLTDMSARLARQVPDPAERIEILRQVPARRSHESRCPQGARWAAADADRPVLASGRDGRRCLACQ